MESRIRELDRLALCYVPNVRSSGTSYSIDQISAGLQARSAAYTEKKDASVIKSAAVGAIIAGPTGAVVGAIHAADKNNRNKKDK